MTDSLRISSYATLIRQYSNRFLPLEEFIDSASSIRLAPIVFLLIKKYTTPLLERFVVVTDAEDFGS